MSFYDLLHLESGVHIDNECSEPVSHIKENN